MNSSDQGNMQGQPAGGNQASGGQASQNQQSTVWGDEVEGLDIIGIDGFSYGEVRRLDRQGVNDANRQSSTQESGSRQGGE